MYRPHDGPGPEPIGFLLIPQFSSLAFFSAVEPLRVANRLAGRALFSWRLLSVGGEPVEASNGMRVLVDGSLAEAAALPTLIVCAGFDPAAAETRTLLAALRRLARAGVALGGLDTGPHILAKAGLLDGGKVTLHWEAVPAFREEFPAIEVSDELFEVRPRLFTCST
jgi:AraC family carnitine catabolism transcriptional activator